MSSLLWGLLGATLIGTSDCIARVTAQKVSSTMLFLFIMGLSLVTLGTWSFANNDLPPWHAMAWFYSSLSGLLNLVALYFLYKALARGPVTVASPAASTFAVLLVLLNAMTGEPWSIWQIVAVFVVFIGVSQLARHSPDAPEDTGFDRNWLRQTALFGLAAALAVTLRMFMAQEASEIIGVVHAVTLNRLFAMAGVLLLLIWQFAKRIKPEWPKGKLLKLVLLQTLLETTALAAFLAGSVSGSRVAASIGFSAFAAVTSIVAWVWLGERIGWRRGVWLIVVAAGVALASSVSV